jgi:hypothetical protein
MLNHKIMKRQNFSYTFLLLAFALFSCNEAPTPLGFSLVQDTVELYAINSFELHLIEKEETYFLPLNYVNPGFSLIGEANGYKSGVVIRFSGIPDTLTYVTENDIIECALNLQPERYALGDTLGSNYLSFSVYENTSMWVIETSAEDFFQKKFQKHTPMSTFSGSVPRKDTMDKIIVDFDKALLLDWFKKQAEKKDTIWGISIIPNSDSKIISQFYGSGSHPRLAPFVRVIFNNTKSNKVDTLYLESAMEKNFSITDNKLDDNRLTLLGAICYKPRLSFDISSIPKFAGIHKAELHLPIDRSKCFSANVSLDTIIRLDYFENETDEINKKSPKYYYYGIRNTGNDVFKVYSLTSLLSYWNRNTGKGSLSVNFENSTSQYRLNKFSFYTSNEPDSTKRPKLIVIYSVLKKKD